MILPETKAPYPNQEIRNNNEKLTGHANTVKDNHNLFIRHLKLSIFNHRYIIVWVRNFTRVRLLQFNFKLRKINFIIKITLVTYAV